MNEENVFSFEFLKHLKFSFGIYLEFYDIQFKDITQEIGKLDILIYKFG